ncbi:hypothetical protein [Paraoerskovia marina]|uniref:hypothetical protein n=1 Tax=Paraoerskovia marina TaxID=545619 RepID=UPI00200A4422|nr:hypothetical protein [Paraoerskovia marina]
MWLAGAVATVVAGMVVLSALLRVRAKRRDLHVEHDPMRVLRVQVRLGELAAELRRIEADRALYGRAHHYFAVRGAYDALLQEACELVGLTTTQRILRAGEQEGADERLREELELSSRGWSW